MSQEMNILCCYSCEMFQVHIVKKAKKWQCKVCNAKQSIRRVYFQGSGKDCRLHVQQLNSQKQKGLESLQAADSKVVDKSNVSYDIKDSSHDQQISNNWSDESQIVFYDAMQVCNEEYTYDKQIISNNYEESKSNSNTDSAYESEVFDCTSTNIAEPRFVSSESTCEIEESRLTSFKSICYISNKIETESIDNNIKENYNIFESYEDFDIDLDF